MDVLPSSTPFQRFLPFHSPICKFPPFKHYHYPQRNSVLAVSSGKLSLSHQLFDEIPISDTFAWNNLIQTYLTSSDLHHVISTYQHMLLRGVRPDNHTLPRILSASRLSGNLNVGKQVHAHSCKFGFSSNLYVITALVELYGHLDSVDMAKWIFDKSPLKSAVSWTVLARLYTMQGKFRSVVDLFYQLVELNVDIDSVALATAISASGSLKLLQDGRNIHHIAKTNGLEFDVLVCNSLLKMYIDCGSIRDARQVFDQMPSKDVISWTEMIQAYVKKGGINEALKLFRKMNVDGIKPDPITISSILPACGRIAAHKHGKEIHGYVLRNGIDFNLVVQNAVMDMYVKSGFIKSASKIFSRMTNKDAISWTVMILGYSLHGQGKLGVDLFHKMEKSPYRMQIDQITYTAVLHACSSACMVEEGRFYINFITSPTTAHFVLMVSLLARCGHFDEARKFIAGKNIDHHVEVLRALLDGCRIHQELKMGKRVVEKLCNLEPLNAENYVLLSNWYAFNGKWEMVEKMRETIRDMGLKPKKAYSWIEFRNKVHVFGTGDVSHPRSEKIYWQLQSLLEKMEDEEHVFDPDFSFHDVDEERECIRTGHGELLALSFGLISTDEGATIRITKNHRVCNNCHESAKLISKIVGREIVLKDPNCFHHFRDGCCSCRDLW